MQFEESIEVQASPKTVFALYADVAAWASWDPDVRSSAIAGRFASGATGRLKPAKGPESKITFTEVVADKSFTVESRLPLCVMRFEHELSATSRGTTVMHRVSFLGLLAPLFGRVIGGQIRKGLPRTLAGLKRAAERSGAALNP
ncbi:SRPBCC family protein [Variovorax sp. OV329]|uniref:SRPBCC family protein n=1 Tax=Variovorax sp. OV329 TaxID=1882825 RepID=UPI0008DEF731|nr:SRPBCC family protein [Variovorax sp. OV329]SFN08201.1 Polyketide cyclase / dehydrase and lipid transport [Variovorax sp. OV329]